MVHSSQVCDFDNFEEKFEEKFEAKLYKRNFTFLLYHVKESKASIKISKRSDKDEILSP